MAVTLTRDMPRITGGTISVVIGSANVHGLSLSTLWQSTVGDRVTKNFGKGSWLRVTTHQPVMIASCDDDDDLTLSQVWAGSAVTNTADYEIINPTLNSSAQVADQIDALLRRGDITAPFPSFSIDGGAARIKIGQTVGALAGIMVGTTAGGDAGLAEALTIDPVTKQVDHPFGSTTARPNLLVNGSLQIWQRNTTFTATGYCADHVHAAITGTMTVARYPSAAPLGAQYYLSATSGADGATVEYKIGLETKDAVPLRTRKLTASCRVYRGAAWSGGLVTMVIETRTATNDLLITGAWTVQATATITPTTGAQTLSVTADLASAGSIVGVRVRIFHASGLTNTHVLYVGAIKLEVGPNATPLVPPTFSEELLRCQRYYCKSYDEGVVPGTAASTINYIAIYAISTSNYVPFGTTRFPTQMRVMPTLVCFNPTNANDTTNPVRNISAATDAPITTSALGSNGFHSRVNNVATTVNQIVAFHFTADAEMA
jgi:hypothetical protein